MTGTIVIVIGEIIQRRDAYGRRWEEIEQVRHPDLPRGVGGPVVGHGNTLSIESVAVLRDFVQKIGLYRVLFTKAGLLCSMGVHEINWIHAELVNAAYMVYPYSYPGTVARCDGDASPAEKRLAYLHWFSWWIDYTVQTSKHPGVMVTGPLNADYMLYIPHEESPLDDLANGDMVLHMRSGLHGRIVSRRVAGGITWVTMLSKDGKLVEGNSQAGLDFERI